MYMYVPILQEKISIILGELETALRQRINSRTWLDDTTKARAVNKLNSINELLAYPDYVFNNSFLNEYYSTVRQETRERGHIIIS